MNRISHLYILFCCFLSSLFVVNVSASEIPQWWKDLHQYDPSKGWYEYMTYTSAYFGPNALPVPELYDGRVPRNNRVELSTDVFWGYGDQTQSLSARLMYVAIPGKLALSTWGVLTEHYQTTTAVRNQRASLVESGEETLFIGDIYLSTLFSLCREKNDRPDLNLEFVLKTASSKSAKGARYFDTPGYYIDLTAGKSLHFRNAFVQELRFVGVVGFLSYQLNEAHQEDALMYGGKFLLSSKKWSFENGIQGYSGWLDEGDRPLLLRSKLNFRQHRLNYFMQYQHALRDYPFRRIQTGICFEF
jgi:hypothetical protein